MLGTDSRVGADWADGALIALGLEGATIDTDEVGRCAPALAAHVMDADVAQRHLAVLGVHLGVVAEQQLEHVGVPVHHRVVDGAAALVLVHSKDIRPLI